MKHVILFISKETGKFFKYTIVDNKTDDEIKIAVDGYNSDEKNKSTAIILKDQHVIDAIIYKDDLDSLKSCVEDFRDGIKNVEDEMYTLRNILDRFEERIEVLEKEKNEMS